MIETKIIKAVFGASKSIVAPKRYKHDYGQEIEFVGIDLPDVFEAHFSNNKTGQAKKQIGQDNVVTVPDEYFVSGADVFCWVMVHDEATDGRTMYTVRIPVMERPEPINAEPTPVQQDVIAQAITALNEAVAQTAQDVESADASAQSAKADADRAETARDTAEEYVSTVQNYAQQAQASANNASASATASANSASQAQQMKTDVQELVSDAQSAAGASAQFALESDQSASQASASAASANQSAETASTKASEASTSAQTAGAKATEASGYASTASQKASESSQSASAASGYATQAGQAKTAAETAQGLAEQAQVDAESAKDDAESARDTAQQIVSGISGKVEQIDQNTADIASLEADRYKAYVADTATGAVASFPDGADDVPMVDVLVNIVPVQDLSHGDPSPDNICPISGWTGVNVVRTGVNVWDEEIEFGGINADNGEKAQSNDRIRTKNYISIVPNAMYYIYCPALTSFNARTRFYDADKNYIGYVQKNGTSAGYNRVFTAPTNAYYMLMEIQAEYGTTYNNDISINYPSTDHDYHSYTGNLYPVVWQDINIWDEEWEAGSITWNTGTDTASTTRIRSKNYIPVLEQTTYHITCDGKTCDVYFYDSDKNWITQQMIPYTGDGNFTTPSGTKYIRFTPYATYGTTYNHDIAINYPSTYHDYYEHKGVSYGTIYGGTLDVTTGVLTVDRAMVDLGTLYWNYTSGNNPYFSAAVIGMAKNPYTSDKLNCSVYPTKPLPLGSFTVGIRYSGGTSSVMVKDPDYSDAATFKSAMSGIQLCYELATPITYQLTPTEIRSLLGQNNVFADTGDPTVEYRADTKLYIQKKITEAVNALT